VKLRAALALVLALAPAGYTLSRPGTDVPVLLVPGWFDSARDLAALRIHLLGAGWPDGHVRTITFEDPTGSNRDHADELERAVALILAETEAEEVDIVAHSMGGLAARWYLLTRPGAPVRRVVFLGSPHRGTLSAHLAWGGGREEMMPDSPFLDSLNTRQPVPEGVEVVTVRTLIDTHIVPGESATLPGVPDYALCCPTHAGLLRSPDVFDIVRSFLDLGAVAREPSNGFEAGPR
jgi:triacylglycerol esterase/lipase EstA (alpha/beta hydrolase family)